MPDDIPEQHEEAYALLRQLAAGQTAVALATAWQAYEAARLDGLCHDGAWEIALTLLARVERDKPGES